MATATTSTSANSEPLVILASARKNSDTQSLVDKILADQKYKLVNLLDCHISPYSYNGKYTDKDKFASITKLMLQHEHVIFATPVYWYSMSGLLKNFLDRLTDLVTIQKQLGRQMAGRKVSLLATGSDEQVPLGFEEPFRLTAAYFEMHYIGCYYCPASQLQTPSASKAISFVKQVYT